MIEAHGFGRRGSLLPFLFLFFLLLFVVHPSWTVLSRSVFVKGVPGLGNLRALLERPHLFRIVWQSILVAGGVALCATALGACIAVTVFRTRLPLRGLFRAAAVLPLIIPGFVSSLSFLFLFGRNGLITYKLLKLDLAIYTWKSVFLIQVMDFATIAFLLVSASLLTMDGRPEDAARTLGASETEVFRTVTLPLLRPGLLASGILVFMRSMADFGTPLFLGGRFATLASASYSQLIGSYNLEMASAMNTLLLLICLVAFLLFRRAQAAGERTRQTAERPPEPFAFPRPLAALLWGASALFSAFVLMILGSVLLAAFTRHLGANFDLTALHFQNAFLRGWRGMLNTLIFASSAALLASLGGMTAAWFVVRRPGAASRALDLLATAPFAIPGTFLGVGYILAFNQPPIMLAGTWALVLILTVVRELPLGLRSGVSVLSRQDGSAEDAAATLGDGAFGAFFRIVLPLARPAMIATALHAFVATVQTVGALIFIVSPGTKLLSVDVFEAVYKGEIGTAAALSVVMLSLSAAGMAGILLLTKKKGAEPWIPRELASGRTL